MPSMTVTNEAHLSDERVDSLMSELAKEWEWVERSPSFPVFYLGVLQYTVTITYGNLE